MKHAHITKIEGTQFQIGEALGKLGKAAFYEFFEKENSFEQLRALHNKLPVDQMINQTRKYFHSVWDELRGLSYGLGIDVEDVFLWNCFPGYPENGRHSSGTMAINRWSGKLIMHELYNNHESMQQFHIVDIKPLDKPGFIGMYLPGLLPCHAFSANRAGVIQTLNFLDSAVSCSGIPSMVISRAILDCLTLAEAIDTAMAFTRVGNVHHILASVNDHAMISIEATKDQCTIFPIAKNYAHTNHLLHQEQKGGQQGVDEFSLQNYSELLTMLDELPTVPDEGFISDHIKQRIEAINPKCATQNRGAKINNKLLTLLYFKAKNLRIKLMKSPDINTGRLLDMTVPIQ